ncbi:MAG: MerR family transcriptional regulator [Chloroflexia bacterium]|nr:MerR family transcriptional regulator [Chloroflexia bacterium]
MPKQELTVEIVARRVGVSRTTVRRYIRRGLLREELTEAELPRLRRICRLRDLGVNLAGVEIILHMRRQILELQAELARLGWQQSRPRASLPPTEAKAEKDT